MFPSTAVEWQPVECLSGTFKAIHKGLADVIHADKSPSFFKDNNLFVYFSQYKVPTREGACGELQELPIPSILSLEWESPDPCTTASFITKITDDVLKAMTPGRISRRIRIQWFLTVHVFVSCFRYMELQRTRTMWLNRRLPPSEVDKVLVECKADISYWRHNKLQVSPNSMSISYQISRQSH